MHHYDPSSEIQNYLVFGEYGDVNPSITDSSTFTFLDPKKNGRNFLNTKLRDVFYTLAIGIRQIKSFQMHLQEWKILNLRKLLLQVWQL